jgi:hypothetical protein
MGQGGMSTFRPLELTERQARGDRLCRSSASVRSRIVCFMLRPSQLGNVAFIHSYTLLPGKNLFIFAKFLKIISFVIFAPLTPYTQTAF